jgi:signal transduction histidine kinase
LSENGREYVEAILTSVARLTDQIENVLDLSQSEAGMLPLALEPVDLFALMRQLVQEREALVHTKELELDLRGSSLNTGKIEPTRAGWAALWPICWTMRWMQHRSAGAFWSRWGAIVRAMDRATTAPAW